MRYLLWAGLFLAGLAACDRGKSNVEITAEIKEAAGTKVYLEQIDVNAIRTIDSSRINKKGHVTFKLHVTTPTFYALRFSNKERITLVAVPDEKQEISGTLTDIKNNYWVDGSENSLWIKLLNFQLNRTTALTDSLSKAFQALPKDAQYDGQREEYSLAWQEALEKQINFTREFIMKHAVSPVSYYALYQKITPEMFVLDEWEDYQYFKIVASSMNALYPESQYTKAVMNHLKEISQGIRNQQLQDLISNTASSLPKVRLPDAKGNLISLDGLKDKLIILDFNLLTASESKAHIRELKRVYDKFRKQGVEIYQICLDKSRLLWENAAEAYGIQWICVWDENALQSSVARSWNIKEIPANYIVNQKEEIVGKNLYGDRLEDRLRELLQQ